MLIYPVVFFVIKQNVSFESALLYHVVCIIEVCTSGGQ